MDEEESKKIIFELLDIIYEQSEAIGMLLIKIGPEAQPEFYQEAITRHLRTRAKFMQIGEKLGWAPSEQE